MNPFDAIMIRAGDFGTDFGTKLILCVLALGLCAWDAYRHRRWDLAWTMLIGTGVWAAVEFLMQRADTRELADASLFGASIPHWFEVCIQGGAEGGAMAVFALFFADRLRATEDRRRAVVSLVLLTGLIVAKGWILGGLRGETPQPITSARDMFDPKSLLYVAVMVVSCGAWLYTARREARRRAAVTFGVLLVIGIVFTTSQVVEGGRWISNNPDNLRQVPSVGVAILLFAYNLLAEFGVVVLAFFALPSWLRLINDHRPAALVGRHPLPDDPQTP